MFPSLCYAPLSPHPCFLLANPFPLPAPSPSDGELIMGQSSTWCCNPQFRITVRKACEVLVCLGQQDPRVEYRRHVRKQMRRKSIGLQVGRGGRKGEVVRAGGTW